jgi:hypothetical protein
MTKEIVKSDDMSRLRKIFPTGEANEINFVLFSTSGIHGSYATIEDAEIQWRNKEKKLEEVTFLVVQPRLVHMIYGNCIPESEDDFIFLKKLRQSSWDAVSGIGKRY